MSLNGLDEATVAEAYQTALAENGGWFLLKYATRDRVELLSRGLGGVAEVRSAIATYEEKSPLYGLVQSRRKKVILKYVPDGTSRLLQVRLTVQFQSVLETFVPHDGVLSFAAPSELTESALISACMLHPPSTSLTSSSSSLRRQPLQEISEDVEESTHVRGQSESQVGAAPASSLTDVATDEQKKPVSLAVRDCVDEKAQPLLSSDHQSIGPNMTEKESIPVQSPSSSTSQATSATPTPVVAAKTDRLLSTPPDSKSPTTSDGQDTTLPKRAETLVRSPLQDFTYAYRAEETESRVSIQSVRPSLSDVGRPSFSSHHSYSPYMPKVKRGPRPHLGPETRPQTAGSAKTPQARRLVANLPTSVRTQTRSSGANTGRPGSQQSSRSVPSRFVHYSHPPDIPPLPSPNHISSLFLPQSQHDQFNLRAGSITSNATTAPTPEKIRLMKALQMRKRTQQQAKRELETPKVPAETDASVPPNIQADSESIGSQSAAAKLRAESTSASHMEEAAKAAAAARMASPISVTNVSEVPSTQNSSLSEDNDGTTSHASISSETSSSVTPKADVREAKQRRQIESPTTVPPLATEDAMAATGQETSNMVNVHLNGVSVEKAVSGPEAESIPLSVADTEAPSNQSDALPDEQLLSKPTGDPVERTQTVVNTASSPTESKVTDEDVQFAVLTKVGNGQISQRRRADVESLKVLSSPDLSEASDDESFMEELRHAQVQQAKHVAVGRSPVTPVYHSISGSNDRIKDISRTDCSSLHDMTNGDSPIPDQSRPRSVRSISTALPSWPPSTENIPPVPLARKGPLSSGISKRIKALEVFTSGREPSSSPSSSSPNTLTQKSKAALTASKKRLPFVTGGDKSRASSVDALPALLSSPAHTPDREPAGDEHTKSLYQRESSAAEFHQPLLKGEAMSVTARIVRNLSTTEDDSATAANGLQQMPLQRSKVTIEHERSGEQENRPAITRNASAPPFESPTRSPQTHRARPSFSSYRSDSQPRLPTSDSMASRLSMTSGKRKDKTSFARSSSDNSSFTEEKSKQSRARRLIQRMSILSTSSRRNFAGASSTSPKDQATSETITERAESDRDLVSVAELPTVSHVVDIGDVNVQFPDTLLWKRRFLRIDDQGYLVFTLPNMERNTRNISRKFHLNEFKKPTLPDVEREEMAWSILLDLEDGSCIQCACESRYTQAQVLRMLVDAHSVYHILDPA